MFVIFKSMNGCDYPIYNDKGQVARVIKFKGGCYANDISDADFITLKNAYPSFERAIKKGYIVVNENRAQVGDAVKESVKDTLESEVEKQKTTRKKAAAATNVEVTEA